MFYVNKQDFNYKRNSLQLYNNIKLMLLVYTKVYIPAKLPTLTKKKAPSKKTITFQEIISVLSQNWYIYSAAP